MPIRYGFNSLRPHLVEYSNTDRIDKVVLAASKQGYMLKNVSPGEVWEEGNGEEFLGVYDTPELARKAAISIIKKDMRVNAAVAKKTAPNPQNEDVTQAEIVKR
ncbi:MAG: hypothetical protein LBT59_11370 [Clostridiales bacterium]|jgi:hypothetical protein|nr:hypothetical protein [Clostridiales bacterium]